MAYVEKYYISYCDDFNTPRRVSILQRDYVGSATELLADVNPISISYESSEDFKFSPIRPSVAEVFMIFNSEGSVDFEEFWTADEKEFLVKDIKDGTVEWSGYVIPNGFQYEFKGGLYYASIEASDGLATLDALKFVDDNQRPYGNQDLVYNNGFEFPPSLIVTEILKKLELDLDLWTCVDSYERTMVKTGDVREADPLSACFFNTKTYIKSNENEKVPYWFGSGEEWNCKEVLENVLHIFGAKLYQEFGVWRLKSINTDTNFGQRYPKFISNKYYYEAKFNDTIVDAAESVVINATYTINNTLYSDDSELIFGSFCTNTLGGTPATEGYYKLTGIDKIVRISSLGYVDIVYAYTHPTLYWRKYNTAGVYLFDYEAVEDEINIPCNSLSKVMIGNDHTMSMDDVYRAFRMNYEYTFIRDGDSPINVLPNGDFCNFNNTSILAAPDGWYRWRRDNKWYIRIKDIEIPFEDAGGHTCGIEIGTHKAGIPIRQGSIRTDPNPAIWTSLRTYNEPDNDGGRRGSSNNVASNLNVLKGDTLTFSVWNRYKGKSDVNSVRYYPIYRLILVGNSNSYYLRNNTDGYTWEKLDRLGVDTEEAYFFYVAGNDAYSWKFFEYELQDLPESGYLDFHIHGLAASNGRNSDSYPAFKTWRLENGSYKLSSWLRVVRENWVDEGGDIPRLQITGLMIGRIPDANELPNQQDYIYENTNLNYTLQVDPITVYNGDVQDENHISNIIVPTNTTGGKNFWDDLNGSYGESSLGLLIVREIMRQYQKPYRILEGTIKLQDARFGSVYTLDVLPNVRFILQRGTFNKQKQYIENATFVQISDDFLPDGGSEGGNTLNPEWVETGNVYCQVGSDALNTGYVIVEQIDVNPNSETYSETREIVSDDQDLTQCPLLTPRLYYWGSDDVYLNTFTLEFSPFIQVSSKEVEVSFDNDEGNYLYFVHLKTLGAVERIYTLTSPNNVISDWVYLADVVINGYIYRVLRTDYTFVEFSNFTHNFIFE